MESEIPRYFINTELDSELSQWPTISFSTYVLEMQYHYTSMSPNIQVFTYVMELLTVSPLWIWFPSITLPFNARTLTDTRRWNWHQLCPIITNNDSLWFSLTSLTLSLPGLDQIQFAVRKLITCLTLLPSISNTALLSSGNELLVPSKMTARW